MLAVGIFIQDVPGALFRLPEKDSTKLSGLNVNVNLIKEIREQDERTGGDGKGMEESDEPRMVL